MNEKIRILAHFLMLSWLHIYIFHGKFRRESVLACYVTRKLKALIKRKLFTRVQEDIRTALMLHIP